VVPSAPTTFREFAERKTREARAASLPPYTTDVEHSDDHLFAVGNDWSRALFGGAFYMSPESASRPGCNLVLVQSANGNTGARNPGDLGGGEIDKHLVYEGLSRVAVDAVMAGAETIRGGDIVFSVWHPQLVSLREACRKRRHPIQIVATLRGVDLDRGILFNTPEVRVVLLTVRSCADAMASGLATRRWIDTLITEQPTDLATAFAQLRSMGVERVSCVGGRNIASQLLDAGLIDDIYLTTTPRPSGEPGSRLVSSRLGDYRTVVRKLGTGVERGVVFSHYAAHTPLQTAG
jgi:riboflavin biosynthesis pyrimidine reductase